MELILERETSSSFDPIVRSETNLDEMASATEVCISDTNERETCFETEYSRGSFFFRRSLHGRDKRRVWNSKLSAFTIVYVSDLKTNKRDTCFGTRTSRGSFFLERSLHGRDKKRRV